MVTLARVVTDTLLFPNDGFTIKAFLARPAEASGQLPTIIVLHEWWGLNDHTKDITRRFAEAGYAAAAPDLYSRLGSKVTSDPAEAAQLMNTLSSQAALRDFNAATKCLKTLPSIDPLRIGVVGFSMGGTLALTMATHNSDLKAAVVFYGKVPPIETLDSLLCPVLYHYGAKDGWVTRQEVDRLKQGFAQYGKPGEIIVYPDADHAFLNNTRLEVYRKEDAERAWRRTLQFFEKHLR